MSQTLGQWVLAVQEPVRRRGTRLKLSAATVVTIVAVALAIVHFVVSAIVGVGTLAPYGLIHSVPVTFYLSVTVSVVAVVLLLMAGRERPLFLSANVVVLAVVLHGTAAVLEDWARFPTAWLHAGYTESVMVHQDVAPELGARFSWPAFFTAAAAVLAGSGDGVPEPVLRWAPVFFQLAYLAPLHVIASRLCASWRTTWLALVFFSFANWVGQDYFAPQAGALLLSLCIMATVLRSLSGPPKQLPLRVPWGNSRASAPGAAQHDGPASAGPAGSDSAGTGRLPDSSEVSRRPSEQIVAVLFITLLAAVLAVSHQLTPFVLSLQLGALWAVRRLKSLMLPVLVGLVALLWTSWGAVDFWVSHLDDVFGGVGDPGGVLQSSVGTGGQVSPEHSMVVGLRILYASLLGIGAVAGIVRAARWSRGIDLTVPALAAIPVALVFLQDYGGEIVLRVFLYATPFIAILLAQAFVPGVRLRRVSAVSLIAALTLAAPLLLVAKYGNESFERVTPSDVALGTCLYDSAAPGTAVFSMSPHLAWQFTDVKEHSHSSVNEQTFDTPSVPALVEKLPTGKESYVVLSESQSIYVERVLGGPEGWDDDIVRGFSADPRFDRVCANDEGSVYRFSGVR